MTLNDFLAKASDLFAKADPNKDLEAALATTKADLAKLAADHSETVKALETAKTTISDLTAKLEKAQTEVNKAGTEIKTLQAAVEAEKKRTDETLASMGVAPKTIPAAPDKPANPAASEGEARIKEIEKLEGAERVAFYRKHKAAIDAAYSARR